VARATHGVLPDGGPRGEVVLPGRLEHPWSTRHPLGGFTVTGSE
jgi:hypothetical protein